MLPKCKTDYDYVMQLTYLLTNAFFNGLIISVEYYVNVITRKALKQLNEISLLTLSRLLFTKDFS